MNKYTNSKCICELCQCGKHTCFNRPSSIKDKGRQLQNNYLNVSNQYLASPPLNNVFHYNNISSTYQDHYKPNQRLKTDCHVSFKNIGDQTLTNNYSFQGTSNYQDSYNKKYDTKIVNAINPEFSNFQAPQYVRPYIKFEGQSRYKTDFQDSPYMQKIRQVNSQKANRRNMTEQKYAFKGTSTYKSAFQPFIFQMKKAAKDTISTPSIKFEGVSDYKDNYKSFKIKHEIPSQCQCPVEHLPVPFVNSINDQNHIYYDSQLKRFI